MNFLSKMFGEKNTEPAILQDEMEVCVQCGTLTSVSVSTPIESRPNFISGCGQLCPECFAKLCDSSADDENSRLVCAVFQKNEENT